MPAKEKFPSLGAQAPEVRHCNAVDLHRSNNYYMVWWDCKGCQNRVMDQRVTRSGSGEPGPVTYYAVPPCPLSPNYRGEASMPVPPGLQATPPLERGSGAAAWNNASPPPPPQAFKGAAAAARSPVTPQTGYTREDEEILQAARQIVAQRNSLLPKPPSPAASASHAAGSKDRDWNVVDNPMGVNHWMPEPAGKTGMGQWTDPSPTPSFGTVPTNPTRTRIGAMLHGTKRSAAHDGPENMEVSPETPAAPSTPAEDWLDGLVTAMSQAMTQAAVQTLAQAKAKAMASPRPPQ